MKSKILSFIPATLWTIISFTLLVLPGSDIPKANFLDLIYFDKWVHIGMFGLLTILWCYPFFKTPITSSTILFLRITVIVIIYGIVMEFVQKFFAIERSFDIMDMAADASGALIAFFWVVRRKRKTSMGQSKK